MAPEPSLRDFTWLSGMSWLQRQVEQRKACYQECVVRRLLLNRPGWDAPLFADLEKQYADDKDSRLERIAERKAHLEEDLIHRYSICEARGYRVPPPQDQDLVGACEKIQRFDAALASGMDLEVAKRAYGDLTVKPPPWDWEKMQGLARLELCRRHPDRRAHLFNWDAKSKEPKQQGPDGYWAALISESIDHLHLFWDGADFHANDVLRLVYLYGDVPVHLRSRASLWRPYDQVGRDPDFSAEAERRILDCLLEFKYWLDEQPRAAVCAPLFEARRRHPKAKDTDPEDLYYEMTFWSENHQLLFPAAEYLAGQWLPAGVFMPGRAFREEGKDPARGDFDGDQRMDRAKPRIMRWLSDRLRFGFSEWNAPGYYKEHLQALFNLADFCLDEEIRTRAHAVIDLMFFDIARFTHQGHFGASAGRAYFEHKNCGWEQGVADVIEILFGAHRGVFAREDPAAGMLASSRVYRVPDAIIAIGQDPQPPPVDRSRVSFNFDEAHGYGIGTTAEEDVMRWWSRGAWFTKQVIDRTRELVERYNLTRNDLFKQLGFTGALDSTAAYALAGLSILLSPQVSVSLVGLLALVDEEDLADALSVVTEGSALTRANLYTYRDRHAMLSSVQNFRAGQYNFQTHPCQATLSMGATVWTNHPFAGVDLSAFKEFFEVAVGGAAGVGGFALGTALGSFVTLVAPGASVVLGAEGARRGFQVGSGIGGAIGDLKLLKADHNGPNWWTGSATMPRVVQVKNAAIIAYDPHALQLLLLGHRTHAWFPRDAFDRNADAEDRAEYANTARPGPGPTPLPQVDTSIRTPIIPSLTPVPSVNANVSTGAWIFGRVGDGYVALYSGQKPEWTTTGDWAGKELIAEGKRNVFILQVGSRDEFGSYFEFKRRVLSARIHINGLHWEPADLACSYDVPNGSRLELHYSDGQVRYAGLPFSDDEFPRFENRYAQVAWQQNRYAIQHGGYSLIHDIATGDRVPGGELDRLRHDANLRIYVQNTALFPSDLLGLPVTIIPLYKGTERERALRELVDVLRRGAFDIAGLSEMWHGPDRERIKRELAPLYPHAVEGPDEPDLERFTGGLLLLSRHRIVESHQTIFRHTEGEDSFANKGVLHARIQPAGLPCPVDVFLSHTQGPAPAIGTVAAARSAIRNQIRHLAAFLHSCRDPRFPALLMGDLNVDALNNPVEYAFLIEQLNGTTPGGAERADDLKPMFSSSGAPAGRRLDATSENEAGRLSSFNQGNAVRNVLDGGRFGVTAERLDYLFSWPGTVFRPLYPPDRRAIVIYQSSPGRDLSDHYGLQAELAAIDQRLTTPSMGIESVRVRMTRFWCLETTSGPGDDEVQFSLRVVTGTGRERSLRSMVFEDVGPGAERRIDSGSLELPSPGSFLVIVVSGIEADDFSADDSLGRSAVWIREFELSCLAGTRTRRVLPRLTGDGGEYAVEVELDFG